jgi:hypothetical protein
VGQRRTWYSGSMSPKALAESRRKKEEESKEERKRSHPVLASSVSAAVPLGLSSWGRVGTVSGLFQLLTAFLDLGESLGCERRTGRGPSTWSMDRTTTD